MKTPTIHMNGTSPECLIEGYKGAREAVMKAHAAIAKIEFNARDYYPQGPEAFREARAEHGARLDALHKIETELLEIAISIHDQKDERDEQRRQRSL